jgi:hypothetical protein
MRFFFREKFVAVDPLNVLPQDVLDVVFGYLPVKDLLKLSMASWRWYNTIGNAECMKRIKIAYGHYESMEEETESLLKSNRQYQNVYIMRSCDSDARLAVEKEMKIILKKFANSIKSIETEVDCQRIGDLPKLKRLVFTSNSSAYSTGLFSKLELLDELQVMYCDEKVLTRLSTILPSLSNLKVLDVASNVFNGSNCNFGLRKLACTICNTNNHNFIKFLKSQSETLEDLSIYICHNSIEDVLPTILTMPNLKKLSFSYHNILNISQSLPINNSITHLTLSSTNLYLIMPFLKNLQVVAVSTLIKKFLETLASCPSISIIKYRDIFSYEIVDGRYQQVSISIDDLMVQYPNIQFILTR